jgi:peptidyl-prolyl cis-trans isomerase SurA
LRKGEDFAQLAAAYSDAPDGMKGGNLGWRSLDRLPTMFAEASLKLKVGEVSPVLRSSNGFHLIKLLAKRGGGAAQAVEQTHARHILIKVNEVVSESEARHKLEGLRSGSGTVKALPNWPGFSRRTGRRPKAAILAGSTPATPSRSSSGR